MRVQLRANLRHIQSDRPKRSAHAVDAAIAACGPATYAPLTAAVLMAALMGVTRPKRISATKPMAKLNSGLVAFQRRLAGIPRKAEAEIRKVLEKSADEIVAMMKRLVPVDEGVLRDSIGWTYGAAPKGTTVVASAESSDGIAITIYAGGGDAFHARFVEFGTLNMPARPFFYVSWRANRKRVLARTKRALRKAVKDS